MLDTIPEMERSLPSDVPVPTAEMILLRVCISAYLADLPKSKAQRYLQRVAEALANEEAMSSVVPIRPSPQQAQLDRARRRAIALFRMCLPIFLACMGLDDPGI